MSTTFIHRRFSSVGSTTTQPCLQKSYLPHVSHDRVFLSVYEALQHYSDGHVYIVAVYVLPQVHSGMGLRYTYDGLNVTNCDGDTTSPLWEYIGVCVCVCVCVCVL